MCFLTITDGCKPAVLPSLQKSYPVSKSTVYLNVVMVKKRHEIRFSESNFEGSQYRKCYVSFYEQYFSNDHDENKPVNTI